MPYPKKKNKVECCLTGISRPRDSKYGGKYRYIFALGPDGRDLEPSSLSDKMQNYDDWDLIVKALEEGNKLFCEATLKTRKFKTFVDCDTVPHVIDFVELK